MVIIFPRFPRVAIFIQVDGRCLVMMSSQDGSASEMAGFELSPNCGEGVQSMEEFLPRTLLFGLKPVID